MSDTSKFIYRGKIRKYLYEHMCFCCEQSFLSTMKRMIYFCPECLKNRRHIDAALQVKHNRRRAEKLGLPATLTVQQWLTIINDFDWKCAYCLVKQYRVLEHFIPVNLNGGTTPDNVLPACGSCNCIKSFYHPADILSKDTIDRVTNYLRRVRV